MALKEAVVGKIVDIVFDSISEKLLPRGEHEHDLRRRLHIHLAHLSNWTTKLDKYGWLDVHSISDDTIALDFLTVPRRFLGRGQRPKTKSEDDLLASDGAFLVLGDPGAGKTTTLRRICAHFFHDTDHKLIKNYQYPIFIKASDLRTDIFAAIADTLGIRYISEKKEFLLKGTFDRAEIEISQIALAQIGFQAEFYYEHSINDEPLKSVIIDFLNESHAFLFIDGVEEAGSQIRDQLKKDISFLTSVSSNFGMMASSRSGDYTTAIEGLIPIEIAPLSAEKIEYIVDHWCEEPSQFNYDIKQTKYLDLLDRPLFLNHLCFIFNKTRGLPEQATDVYRRIVLLCLEKWDEERSISRRSKYAGFFPERKKAFLSLISYSLLLERDKTTFSKRDFEEIYARYCRYFGLPSGEASIVADELESHTGIIVADSYETISFSHFSLMEYLSAEHILQEPSFENISKYMRSRSSILAICIALSTDSNRWLIAAISSAFTALFEPNIWLNSLPEFFSRLSVERPNIYPNTDLGIVLLATFYIPNATSRYDKQFGQFGLNSVQSIYRSILEDETMRKSINLVLRASRVNPAGIGGLGTSIYDVDFVPRFTSINVQSDLIKDGIKICSSMIDVLEEFEPVKVKDRDLYNEISIRVEM